MNPSLKVQWNEFTNELKKELTWNNIKIMICVGFPTAVYLYGWTFWLRKLTEMLNDPQYSHAKTPDQAIIVLCITAGIIAPLWFGSTIVPMFGGWLGRVTKFYVDDKTRRLVWDDKEYFVRDMPQEQRDKIKEILSSYKSKMELKRERLADKSWLRRNFS